MLLNKHLCATAMMLAATPALAHPGLHEGSGFAVGFAHPLGGLDHVLAMVSVGLLAASMGGRALWAVPASFIGMMLAGGAMGWAGIGLPAAELGIAASVVVLGMMIASGRSWPVGAATALVGAFAVFHGYAHGAEMPAGAGRLVYGLGFVLATAALHGVGIGLARAGLKNGPALRFAGAAVTAAGLALTLG